MKLTIPDVLEAFRAYKEKAPEWGSLHVVLGDGNYRDTFIQFSIRWANERGDFEGGRLGKILLGISCTQRRKIAALCRK